MVQNILLRDSAEKQKEQNDSYQQPSTKKSNLKKSTKSRKVSVEVFTDSDDEFS